MRLPILPLAVGFLGLAASCTQLKTRESPPSSLTRTKPETELEKGRADATRAYAPIRHKPYFKRERELYGYAPKYSPGIVSYDRNNRPYMVNHSDKPTIQTLNDAGQWIELDFCGAIQKAFPEWDGKVSASAHNRRISFDRDGDAYMYVTGGSDPGKALLLHSRDDCRSWTTYLLPFKEHGRLEVNDTFNLTPHPPAILFFHMPGRQNEMWLIAPKKNPDGSLTIPEPKLVTKESANLPFHSGDGNSTVSVGDNIHIIWLHRTLGDKTGTRHFANTYDRRSGKMSEPVFVGRSQHHLTKVDAHNLPVMTVDGNGYLHAVLGTHHHPFTYVKSLNPDSIQTWSEEEIIGTPKRGLKGEGSYSYPSINCDPSNNLHVVSRWTSIDYKFNLVHMERSNAEGRWLPHNLLVNPYRGMYGCWYHKVSIDRSGNLVVYYINYLNQLNEPDLVEYNRRWPEDGVNLENKTGQWDNNIKGHDPAILMRQTGDPRWFLARTQDFIGNLKE